MSYCEKCGAPLSKEAQFCPNCGAPVAHSGKDVPSTQHPVPNTKSGTMLNTGNIYGRFDLEKLPEGHIIDDRYEIIRKLGQGSFGAVYLADDRKMEMQKVLKVIPEAISNDKKAMLLLRKEAAIMAKLNHKNIVRVYDFHDSSGLNYIDMEYVDGQSLAELLLKAPGNKLPEEDVRNCAIQIAEGLAYAHDQRVIHKDIKPQNIMLTKKGAIKLMDFGIAETVHSSMSRLKNTGSSGTLVYMSPEQLRGKDVGKESDIYSLGATLYELLSGNPPFYQGDIYSQIINEEPEPLHDVSAPMNALVLQCIEKQKGNRFRNCEELSDALKNPEKYFENITKNNAVKLNKQHQPETTKKGVKKPVKRHTWVLWTILLIVVGAGAAYYFLFPTSKSKEAKVVHASITGTKSKPKTKKDTVQIAENKTVKSKLPAATKNLKKNRQSIDNKVAKKAESSENKGSVAIKKVKSNIQAAFVSVPEGAEVIINGKSKGKTPVIFSQQKGIFKVELKRNLYYDTILIINFDKNQKFNVTLKQRARIITFDTKPEGSALYLDGNKKGTTPIKLAVNFGEHNIRLVNGKHTIKKNILFSETSPYTLNFKMNQFVNYTETTQNLDIEMVAVKGGSFQMGSNDGNASEKPVHTVTLSNFYIGKYEITQKQWKAVMGSNPSYFKGDNLPVEQVSWNDVQEFLKKLNQITGKHYRLPTEAEWEYAARGGDKSMGYKYSGSNNINEVAWYSKNSNNQTHPVGQKQPNELGIYDMSGNVWEWCNDWYSANYYSNSPETNPQGSSSGNLRDMRGGSWVSVAGNCRITGRSWVNPGYSGRHVGFRVAR